MKTDKEKFIRQEKRVIQSMKERIKRIKERAKEDIKDCQNRIAEAKDFIKKV